MRSVNKKPQITFGAAMSYTIVVMGVLITTIAVNAFSNKLRIVILVLVAILYLLIGLYFPSTQIFSNSKISRYIYIVLQLTITAVIIYQSNGIEVSLLILIPIIGQSVLLYSTREMLGINAIIFAFYIFQTKVFVINWEETLNRLPVFFAGQLFIIVFSQMFIDEENSHQKIKNLVQELEIANSNLKEYANQVEEIILLSERNRLAREIHDGVGHYLTVIHMQIQAAIAILNTDTSKAMEILTNAQHQSQGALIDIRKSINALKDSTIDNIPFADRVNQLIQNTATDLLKIELYVTGIPQKASFPLELALFRIIQEGIQNCIKHSDASRLIIRMNYQANLLELNISDNGKNVTDYEAGFGLMGMEERIREFGGNIFHEINENGGFNIQIKVPV